MRFRYREKNTCIHKVNPLCKILWAGILMVLALIFNHPVYLLLLFLASLPLTAAARIWREWSSFMKFTLYLSLMIIAFNIIINQNGMNVLWQAPFRLPVLGTPAVTLEALVYGISMSLRLMAIISAFVLLTLTVHPDDIMQVLLKIKIPYKSVLVTSLSTRFVPALIDDAERISDIQRTRGLELDRGNMRQRIRNRTAVIIPLLCNSLDRTVQIAEAMEARAFGSGTRRSFYKEIKLTPADVLMLAVSLISLVLGILIRCLGQGDYRYYPALQPFDAGSFEWHFPAALVILIVAMVPLAMMKKRLEID